MTPEHSTDPNAPFTTLVGADRLLARPRHGAVPLVLLDCGFDLADPSAGERAFALGHLPGARSVHLDRDLSGPKTPGAGRHPLPAREMFARRVAAWGVTPATQVVAYDAQGGPYAARAWWLLRWLGHRAVAVLDGGRDAWTAAGGMLETGAPAPPEPAANGAPYPGTPQPDMPTVDAPALLRRLGAVRLLDARAPERFRGEVEPLDPVAGHVPGAANRFFKHNLDAAGRFKPAALLRREFAGIAGDAGSTVHQCGSGVTACHNLLAMEHAGLTGSALFPGSWSAWCADPALPVARG